MKTSFHRRGWIAAVIVIFSFFTINSCDHSYLDAFDNMEDYTYEGTFAIPLVSSSLSINDLIDTDELGAIETDEENLIWLVYKGRVFSAPATEIFSLSDQQYNFTVEIANPGSKNTIEVEEDFPWTPVGDETLNRIKFLSGNYRIELEADQLIADGYTIDVQFEILNSQASDSNTLSGQFSVIQPADVNLEDAIIEFKDGSNSFSVLFTIEIGGTGSPDNAPYEINISQSLQQPAYDFIYGYFGQVTFPVGNTEIELGLYKNASLAEVFFEAPNIEVISKNSFGAPMALVFHQFYASNNDDESVDINYQYQGDHWYINSPDAAGDTALTVELLDRSNTNIDEVMNIRPVNVYYDVSGQLNPEGNRSVENFIKHYSNMSIDVEVNLPLFGRVDNFELQDTLELSSIRDLPEEIEWMELKLTMENGFPFEANVELFFVDENNQIYGALFGEPDPKNIIEAAPTDPVTLIVTENVKKDPIFISLSQDKIEDIRNAEGFILEVNFNTYNHQLDQSVKILDNYRIGIEMGVRVKVKATLSDDD